MYKTSLFLIVLALLFTACAGQPLQPTENPLPETGVTEESAPGEASPTEATPPTEAVETVEPSPAAEIPAAETPEDEGSASSTEPVTFTIVPGESTLTYEVGETFFNENNRFNVAIGSTPAVAGEIHLDLAQPQNSTLGTFTADISQFQSDSSRRDGALRDRYLESSRFPTVTFVPGSIVGLPEVYTGGEPISFQVTGDLTIRDVTQPATFEVTAQLQENTLTGTAATTFLMSAYQFGPISIAGMLGTEDEAKVTLNFVARP